jgi:hypothetical protein
MAFDTLTQRSMKGVDQPMARLAANIVETEKVFVTCFARGRLS